MAAATPHCANSARSRRDCCASRSTAATNIPTRCSGRLFARSGSRPKRSGALASTNVATLAIIVAVSLTAIVLVFGVFAYEILRQNGRLMRRLEAVERALEELAPPDGGTRAGGFGDRSLAGSRINRDGLPPGTE